MTTRRSRMRGLIIGICVAVVAVVAFTAGTLVGPFWQSEDDAAANADALAACETTMRWKDDGQVPPKDLEDTWRGYAVTGNARAAALSDDRYETLGEIAEPVMTAISHLDEERIETAVDEIIDECQRLELV